MTVLGANYANTKQRIYKVRRARAILARKASVLSALSPLSNRRCSRGRRCGRIGWGVRSSWREVSGSISRVREPHACDRSHCRQPSLLRVTHVSDRI